MSEDAINSPMMDFIKKQYSGEKYVPYFTPKLDPEGENGDDK